MIALFHIIVVMIQIMMMIALIVMPRMGTIMMSIKMMTMTIMMIMLIVMTRRGMMIMIIMMTNLLIVMTKRVKIISITVLPIISYLAD